MLTVLPVVNAAMHANPLAIKYKAAFDQSSNIPTAQVLIIYIIVTVMCMKPCNTSQTALAPIVLCSSVYMSIQDKFHLVVPLRVLIHVSTMHQLQLQTTLLSFFMHRALEAISTLTYTHAPNQMNHACVVYRTAIRCMMRLLSRSISRTAERRGIKTLR